VKRRLHFRVSTKVMILFLLIVLVQGGVSLGFVTYIIKRSGQAAFDDQMDRTLRSVQVFLDDAVKDNTVKTALLAGQNKVIDYTYFGLNNLLRQELIVFRDPLKIDNAMVFGRDGSLIALSGGTGMGEAAIKDDVTKHYRDGNPVFILPYDRWIYLVAISPIMREKEIIGYLATAMKLDMAFIGRIEDVTGSRIMLSWKNSTFVTTGLNDYIVNAILAKYYRNDFQDPSPVRGQVRTSFYRVVSSQRLHGLYAYCFLDTQQSVDLLRQYETFSVLFLVLLVVAASAAATGFYRLTFMRPMHSLMVGVQKIASGDLQHVIDTRTEDEFGELAVAFERMTASLSQREREIAELGTYNSLILSSIPSGLLVIDLGGRITASNPAAEAMLGVDGEALPRDVSIEASPIAGELRELILTSLHQEKYVRFKELRIGPEDGERRTLAVLTSPFVSGTGERIGIIAVFTDTTHERKLEEQLQISSRMAAMGEMVAGVAHQIRNPLAVLKVSAEMLKGDFAPETNRENYTRLTDMIIDEIDSLGTVIANFLDFARPLAVKKETVSIESVIERVVSFLPMDRFPETDIQYRFSENLEPYPLDRNLIEQALQNLLMNALEASPAGNPVLVSAWMEEGRLAIEVRDRGSGMNPDIRKRLYDPFFTTKNQGTGLGLSIVHRIIEEHGGSIECDTSVGSGTAFTILL
jgi:PAS domain S-box-containing protein